jgi:hypothetical protein
MSDFTITKRADIELSPLHKEALYQYLFSVLGGVSEQDNKAWRKFWKRINKLAVGEIVDFEAIFPRNGKFHRKFFALLNFAFDAWEPDRVNKSYRGVPVTKNFNRFRKDVTVQAGFYEQTFDLDGNMKLEAQSISFASMDDAEFEQVYSAVADVILQKVLVTYAGRDELDDVMRKVVGFL